MPGQCRCILGGQGTHLNPTSTTGSLQYRTKPCKATRTKTSRLPNSGLNYEPVPAVSHMPLAKLSLNTLCCYVLNELETFRVQQCEPHPTKDVINRTSLSHWHSSEYTGRDVIFNTVLLWAL